MNGPDFRLPAAGSNLDLAGGGGGGLGKHCL